MELLSLLHTFLNLFNILKENGILIEEKKGFTAYRLLSLHSAPAHKCHLLVLMHCHDALH
jgi:hypothetical protein